ncbi:MAG: hypothetical protein FJY67_03785 [Calditrichaeota bacterium]|nr:hypothetical protein [Calditrichota bacterium]
MKKSGSKGQSAIGHRLNSVIAAYLLGLLAGNTADAATGIGGKAGAFLRMGMGADRAAMGDCGVALTSGALNWHYNPAALGHQRTRQGAIGYRLLALDRSILYGDVSVPLQGGRAAVGAGYLRAATSNIDARDSNGERFDVLTNSENLIHGTFSLAPLPALALGISIKWMINNTPRIAEDEKSLNAYGMGIDLGVRFVAHPKLTLGLQVRDINAKYSWDASDVWGEGSGAKDDAFPVLIRAGAAWKALHSVTIASDMVIESAEIGETTEALVPRLGIEYSRAYGESRMLYLRGGWDGAAPTFGLGLELPLRYLRSTRLDYAFVLERAAPSGSHIFGWTFAF